MAAKRVSEHIADWLVRQGVEQVFTVTGGGAMFLNQALGGHAGLRCAFMHHEQACAMAAEGYARVAGKPAVAMLTTGPGAINALNGVFGAYTDSIPMIVISGQVKRETCLDFNDLPDLRQLGDQEGPTLQMAKPVCKYTALIREPQDIATALPAAYAATVSGRPGPVWLDIPLDVQSAVIELEIPDAVIAPPLEPAGLDADCAAIVAKLKAAHRPLILGGTGVRIANAAPALVALAERLGVPVATAWTHDLIASDHPLFAGRPGTIGTRPGNFALQAADLVIVIGSRLNIRQSSYNWDSFAKHGEVIQVDVDAAELHKPGVQPDVRVQADAGAFIAALARAADGQRLPDFSPWQDWVRALQQRFDPRLEHLPKEGPLNPYRAVDRIFQHLRPDDVVACGNASACILPFQMGRLGSGNRLFSNSGSASMGYDLPAALGAACAQPGRRVICFAGDGSLQMNVQELQTLKTLGLPVIVIVLNNAGYLSIWQTHENFFGRVIGATPATGVEFPDFEALAKAYRLPAVSLEGEGALAELDRVLTEEDGPLLVNLHVDPRQGFEPRIKSRVGEDGKFITPELDDMHPFLPEAVRDAVRAEGLALRAR